MGRSNKKRKNFVPIGEVLGSKFLGGRLSSLTSEYKIISLWRELVGKSLAKRTMPYRIFRGTLVVNVQSSSLSSQLYFLKSEIIKKINKILGRGVVEDIKFQVKNLKDNIFLENKNQNDMPKEFFSGEVPPLNAEALKNAPLDKETRDIIKNIIIRASEIKGRNLD